MGAWPNSGEHAARASVTSFPLERRLRRVRRKTDVTAKRRSRVLSTRAAAVGSVVEGLEGGDEGGGNKPGAQVFCGCVEVLGDGGGDKLLNLGQPGALVAAQRLVGVDDPFSPTVARPCPRVGRVS
jgi:hypothetical protein